MTNNRNNQKINKLEADPLEVKPITFRTSHVEAMRYYEQAVRDLGGATYIPGQKYIRKVGSKNNLG